MPYNVFQFRFLSSLNVWFLGAGYLIIFLKMLMFVYVCINIALMFAND